MAENAYTREWTDEGHPPEPSAEDVAEREYQMAQERERQRLGIIPGGPDSVAEAVDAATRAELDEVAEEVGADTTGAKTKADVAEAIQKADLPDLASMKRDQLDKVAVGYGLDPADYRTKADVRAAIVEAHG